MYKKNEIQNSVFNDICIMHELAHYIKNTPLNQSYIFLTLKKHIHHLCGLKKRFQMNKNAVLKI